MILPDVVPWLATATGSDPSTVAAELTEGERRREFVVDELIDAEFEPSELLTLVVRLTGLPDAEARALIAARQASTEGPRVSPPRRDRRLAENEIRVRYANDWIARPRGTDPVPPDLEVVCECADPECRRKLAMRESEYEWLRQHPWRFVVLPGHEAPAIEDVVERLPGYVIVETHPEPRALVAAADPRAPLQSRLSRR
jgi:hypothetical protein